MKPVEDIMKTLRMHLNNDDHYDDQCSNCVYYNKEGGCVSELLNDVYHTIADLQNAEHSLEDIVTKQEREIYELRQQLAWINAPREPDVMMDD